MALEQSSGVNSLIDVLDRVLDKGIVVDAWVRVANVGIDLITIESRAVVVPLQLQPPPDAPPSAAPHATHGKAIPVRRR